MIRLIAEDPGAALDERQVRGITFWLLEMIPARRCDIRPEPIVEITIDDHEAEHLHPPLLHRVEDIAGCRFRVVA